MAILDRKLQKEILTKLADAFPEQFDFKKLFEGQDHNLITGNLRYLHQHGLLYGKWYELINGPAQLTELRITAQGLDFLADDGGLSAILGVVTVKLHEDTIKDLLISEIENSDASKTVKSSIITKIKELPADAMQAVTLDTLKAGLRHLPDTVEWLQKLLGP